MYYKNILSLLKSGWLFESRIGQMVGVGIDFGGHGGSYMEVRCRAIVTR